MVRFGNILNQTWAGEMIQGRKFWKQEIDNLLSIDKTYSENHINCYVDLNKNTSKTASCYAYKSYQLSNLINIDNISNELKDGFDFIYSKNIAHKILSLNLKQKNSYIYMDNSYFSKFYDKKISKFRLLVNHIHPQKQDLDEIENKYISLLPWKERVDEKLHILLCPPTGNLLSLFSIKPNWTIRTIKEIRQNTNREILVRFKSYDFLNKKNYKFFKDLNIKFGNIKFDQTITDANLLDLFEDCYAVVAPASGVGVIAATMGIPVFSESIGPVASISQQNYALINNPIYPDRNAWLNTILAHEFSFEDIYSGQWLIRLKKIYQRELKRILDDQINLL